VAMPKEELFATDKAPTTASVLVSTTPGVDLDNQQVQAIVHLVASSVEGLSAKQVTVSDASGRVLSAAGDDLTSVGDTRSQTVQTFEDKMSGSVDDLLTRIVGPGNSATEVTADLNFDKTLTNTTRYFRDPKVGALTSTTESETYGGGANTANGNGVVGPDGQLTPGADTSQGVDGSSYDKRKKTVDNALGQTTEQREAAPGSVDRINVAVAIDTQSLGATTPDQVQALVTSALGIDPKRGDSIVVTPMPFDRSQQKDAEAALAAEAKADGTAQMLSYAKTGGIVLVIALVLLLAWLKGRKRRKLRDQAATYVVEQLRRGKEPVPALPPGPPMTELVGPDLSQMRLAARDEINAMVERQPEEVANLLRGWLVETDA
jgi:flagellar M-ring protein FliF